MHHCPCTFFTPLTSPVWMAFKMVDLFNPVARAASPNV
jgi:hypothetical protein